MLRGHPVILRTIMGYADLKTAKTFLGPDHPDVLERAGKSITKFMRNFSGMAYMFRRVLPTSYEVPLEEGAHSRRRRSWYWPRNFFFNYPIEYARTWHNPSASWKRAIMQRYCTEEEISRPITRYELFRIQKKMREEHILDMGW